MTKTLTPERINFALTQGETLIGENKVQELKQLQEEIKALQIPNVEMNELSMGMSGDLEIVIEQGATIVRVGTAVFGERVYPDSYYWNEEKSDI